MQLSVRGRCDVLKRPDVGSAGTSFRNHVKLVKCYLAVDPDVEDPAGFASAGHVIFTVKRLGEMQPQFVHAGREGNLVGERPFAAALINSGLARPEDRMVVRFEHASALKIP